MTVKTTLLAKLARRPAWARRGHFEEGDLVVTHGRDTMPGTVVWVRGGKVGLAYRGVPTAWTATTRARHAYFCSPCRKDLAAQRLVVAEKDTAYWRQWPADARVAYEQAMEEMVPGRDGTLSFGADTPVLPWLRAEFDGNMYRSESPSPALGRVRKPLEWPRICREHPDFLLEPVWQQGGSTEDLLTAYGLLHRRGLQPYLDVDLELELRPVPGGRTAIGVFGAVSRLAAERSVDEETYERVSHLLGEEPTSNPFSALRYPMRVDGPGKDFSKPYERSTHNETVWGW